MVKDGLAPASVEASPRAARKCDRTGSLTSSPVVSRAHAFPLAHQPPRVGQQHLRIGFVFVREVEISGAVVSLARRQQDRDRKTLS